MTRTRFFLGCLITCVLGCGLGLGIGYTLPPTKRVVVQAASCPSVHAITALDARVTTVEMDLGAESIEWTERITAITHAVGTGLVDVACLYRGHLAATHDGYRTDRPVPGSWLAGRLSPLWPASLTAEDCQKRWAP
jgi:hypothetical protein